MKNISFIIFTSVKFIAAKFLLVLLFWYFKEITLYDYTR